MGVAVIVGVGVIVGVSVIVGVGGIGVGMTITGGKPRICATRKFSSIPVRSACKVI